MSTNKNQTGFTLLDVAMALAITGILSTGMINFYAKSDKEQKLLRAEVDIENANSSIKKFYSTNFRLPCPDTDDDGFENCEQSYTPKSGTIPYGTLSMTNEFANGYSIDRVLYGVIAEEANNLTAASSKDDAGSQEVPVPPLKKMTSKQELSKKLRDIISSGMQEGYPYVSMATSNSSEWAPCQTSEPKSNINISAYVLARYIERKVVTKNCFPLDQKLNIGAIIKVSPEEILGSIR